MQLNAETIGVLIAFLVCIGAMFKFFMSRLDRRFEANDNRLEKIERQMKDEFVQVHQKINGEIKRLEDKIDIRCDKIEEKFDSRCNRIEEKLDDIDTKVSDINLRVCVAEMRLEERKPGIFYPATPQIPHQPARRGRKPKSQSEG